jgi:hypothetical protein
MVPRIVVRALEVSCADCMFAFVIREQGVTEAPLQTAHDQLAAVQASVQNGGTLGKDRKSSDDDQPPARPNVARPAPDPRVRNRP